MALDCQTSMFTNSSGSLRHLNLSLCEVLAAHWGVALVHPVFHSLEPPRAAHNVFITQSVYVSENAPTEVQLRAHGLVEPHCIHMRSLLKLTYISKMSWSLLGFLFVKSSFLSLQETISHIYQISCTMR